MKQFLSISLLVFLFVSGCDKISELTQFNLEYNQSVEIPANIGVDIPFDIETPDIETNSEATFKGNNTSKDNIDNIKLTKMELSIPLPTDGTFSFLKSIKVYIVADGLDEIEIAWKENIPENIGNVLNLETSDAYLKEYIIKDNFNLKVKTVSDEVITSNYTIDIHSVFCVDAKILGF